MEATVLIDNFAKKTNVLAEHGYSVHIRDQETQVLLDTGQGHTLVYNSAVLGISLKEIDHLVLSHGHYDHTGGISDFVLNSRKIPIWAHPEINAGHTKLRDGQPFFNGCRLDTDVAGLSPVKDVTQITKHIWAVEIPLEKREPDYINQVPYLVIENEGKWIPDPFVDDISLVVEGDHGLSIILGCSHAGVVNIMQEISNQFNTKDFYCVLGGMHLSVRSQDYNEKIISELMKRFNVQKWRPCHCTGLDALVSFTQKAEDVEWAGAGSIIEL